MPQLSHRTAFTLVEMSIVIVIIGLLIGGIMTGRELVHTSTLRAVIAEEQKYDTAIKGFKDQYSGLPGDLINAVRYWGSVTGDLNNGVDSDCEAITTPSTDPKTCNGNGDGFVGDISAGTGTSEFLRAWQHLSNAGMIEGQYIGVPDPSGATTNLVGVNVPGSKFSPQSGWSIIGAIDPAVIGYIYPLPYRNTLVFGADDGNWPLFKPVLNSTDADYIDSKMDDGSPSTGNVVTFKNGRGYPDCVSNDSDTRYNRQSSQIACTLIFRLPY